MFIAARSKFTTCSCSELNPPPPPKFATHCRSHLRLSPYLHIGFPIDHFPSGLPTKFSPVPWMKKAQDNRIKWRCSTGFQMYACWKENLEVDKRKESDISKWMQCLHSAWGLMVANQILTYCEGRVMSSLPLLLTLKK